MKKNILRRLRPSALEDLAAEIREFLVHSISDTGGHLASNLGVVELTLALHAVFQTPHDKIVWDVGHQAYVHKILTGRKGWFSELRKAGGLSGFPKPDESPHDAFGTGHSSTAISAALGLAVARDLREAQLAPNAKKRRESIIAVVGDGSITGGLAYEGLNNAGRSDTDLLVILNDNQMSISKNVGAISRHLNQLRTAKAYLGAKENVHGILDKLPLVGAPLTKGIESVKDVLKYAILQGVLFEEMGFKYIGQVDGHDISALLSVLRRVRKIRGPVLVHVITTKGKGYNIAEKSPRSFHGVGTFDVSTGLPSPEENPEKRLTFTNVFSEELCKKASKDENIVAITAAMRDGTGLSAFKEKFPARFFDVGIAEGHAVTFAAGLAKGGLRPVVAIYSSFLQRAYDQIIHDVAVQCLPVVFAIDHAGAVAGDGETHQGIFDIAFLLHIPGITVLAPADAPGLRQAMDFAFNHNGPVAIRYPKDYVAEFSPEIYDKSLQNGKKIAIVSVGVMWETSQAVVRLLVAAGFSPDLFSISCIKPIEADLLQKLNDYPFVFTIEDGVKIGGFGERLFNEIIGGAMLTPRQSFALQNFATPLGKGVTPPSQTNNLIGGVMFHAFAFPDIFPETGTREELFLRYGMDAESIAKKINTLISLHSKGE
ncbi:MAG: 1-deoxy-D-xylulose-5-phosphate synthase [Defluviitaleaceae bacterium]|nr:1-deoxy-D-xylulose-5-phosphate synthase [Defluviitaleaceae bacterium]